MLEQDHHFCHGCLKTKDDHFELLLIFQINLEQLMQWYEGWQGPVKNPLYPRTNTWLEDLLGFWEVCFTI